MQSTMVRLAVVMTALMIGAIVALEVLHPGDNSIAIGHILTIGIPTTAALLGLVRSTQNNQRLEDLHEAVNGRMDQQLEQARAAGRMEARRQPGKDER